MTFLQNKWIVIFYLGTPREADFLFVHSTADDYVSYRYLDGSPFIKQLVTVLKEKLKTQHLERALLEVKEKVAEETIPSSGHHYKQMPSVISQMRYEIWWAE